MAAVAALTGLPVAPGAAAGLARRRPGRCWGGGRPPVLRRGLLERELLSSAGSASAPRRWVPGKTHLHLSPLEGGFVRTGGWMRK